jgi:hypothetical protein
MNANEKLQYTIIKATSSENLTDHVNDHLKRGWLVHGVPFYAVNFYHQTMMLVEQVQQNG